jgi:hypothetical protein
MGVPGAMVAIFAGALVVAGCSLPPAAGSPSPSSTVFTPAHATPGDAIREYLDRRPVGEQPIPFPHTTHVTKAMLKCTEYCHESVTKGPVAGLPSVKTCMICHDSIATDRPLIQKVTDYQKRGVDIPWKRVYGFTPEAHVRFDHAPHLRANVDCATCHGDVGKGTVATRAVNHTMGFCVDCHRSKQASNDCLTCHF